MAGLLRRIGVRGGTAVALLVLILGVVAVARFTGGGNSTMNLPDGPHATVTVDPSEGDDAEVAPDPTAFPDDAAVEAAAAAFISAWLQRDLDPADWHAAVAAHATDELTTALTDVDPRGVPATRTTADPTIVLRTDAFAQVAIPVDSGRVLLALRLVDSRWLVDGVDWERA